MYRSGRDAGNAGLMGARTAVMTTSPLVGSTPLRV